MIMPAAVPALPGGAVSCARATTSAGTDALRTPKTNIPAARAIAESSQWNTTKAAAAAGRALRTMTRLRPNLSDKIPRPNDPIILAMLKTPIIQPVSCRVRALAARSAVGVQAAQLQNTDPPMNSATARMAIDVESADLTEPERLAIRVRCRSRTQ